jgi:molybdopterin converting factor small subunit
VPQTTAAITVNGRTGRNRTRALAAIDELTVIPPVDGG